MITIRVQSEGNIKEVEGSASRLPESCWVDVRDMTQEDQERLKNEFGISEDFIADAMDDGELSRIGKEDNYLAVIIRLPAVDKKQTPPYYTLPLGIAIFPDKVVTMCKKSSIVLDDMAANLIKGVLLKNRNTFVLYLLGRAAFYYLKDLKELNKMTSKLEMELEGAIKNKQLVQLLHIQKSLTFFNTRMKAKELLLEKFQKSPFVRFKEEGRALLENIYIENEQAVEMANIYSNILINLMDAFASVISNNLSIVMRRLTIISIVINIPTLIFNFFGMNVYMPWSTLATPPYYSAIAILIVSVLASTLAAIFLHIHRGSLLRGLRRRP
jgi:magnesium transporter